MKRRTFLQQTGWVLAALGLSEAGLATYSDRYAQVLAQPTARKLALLIGINQYPKGPDLSGCITDVELQRELLIHRFGFQAADIQVLTDQAATRHAIEQAFVEHLSQQARPGDVVVIHFSGYGNRVRLGGGSEEVQNSWVTADSFPATRDNPVVDDLLEETLLLLLRSLPTDQITTILDTSHYVPPFTPGSHRATPDPFLRLRSRAQEFLGTPSPESLAFQEDLLAQFSSSRDQVGVQRRSGQMPGVMLAAATCPLQLTGSPSSTAKAGGEKAFEAQWSGFSAGLFTYALTQYLWWTTPAVNLQVSLRRTAGTIEQWVGKAQQPLLSGQKSREQGLLPYHLGATLPTGADGVVIEVEGNHKAGQLWLAGLPARILESYGVNSLFRLVPTVDQSSSDSPGMVQLVGREGLTGRAKIYSKSGNEADTPDLQMGQWVQEAVRLLPRQTHLTVAFDSSLERIERVDATSAFSAIPQVTSVVTSDQAADCLFGRAPSLNSTAGSVKAAEASRPDITTVQILSSEFPLPQGRYGLWSLGQTAIPNTIIDTGEAVKSAVQRLIPQMKLLLANKLLRLTANEGSSRLGVSALLEVVGSPEQILLHRRTIRVPMPEVGEASPAPISPAKAPGESEVTMVPIGSRIRYRIYNYSDRPIYWLLLSLDNNGSLITLHPGHSAPPAEGDTKLDLKQEVIAPGETILIPQSGSAFEWMIREPAGLAETQLIFSRGPFTQTVALLETALRSSGGTSRLGVLSNPLEIVQAILQDLHQASVGQGAIANLSPEVYALDVNTWATLSFIYQVT